MSTDNKSGNFDWVLPRTRRCHSCHGDYTQSYYSMQPGLFDEQNGSAGMNAICNTCRVANNLNMFLEAIGQSWRQKAACAQWNNPTGPRGKPLSLADVEALMFPRTAADKFEKKPWKTLCDKCPVTAECAEYGTRSKSEGVFGGEYRLGPSEHAPAGVLVQHIYVRTKTVPQDRIKSCVVCDTKFTTRSNSALYCSPRCKNNVHDAKRIR